MVDAVKGGQESCGQLSTTIFSEDRNLKGQYWVCIGQEGPSGVTSSQANFTVTKADGCRNQLLTSLIFYAHNARKISDV